MDLCDANYNLRVVVYYVCQYEINRFLTFKDYQFTDLEYILKPTGLV